MIIEKAALEDIDCICRLDCTVIGNESRKHDLQKSVENSECVIAKINGECVGFAICNRSFFGHSFIALVIVDPGFRRRGVAKGLISYIENNAATEKIFTSTNESNMTM